jgi:arylsulfatase
MFFEHEGNAAVRAGRFKLVRQHGADWELYDMEVDRTELHDLAGRGGRQEHDLVAQYQDWAQKVGVEDWDRQLPKLLKAWGLQSVDG